MDNEVLERGRVVGTGMSGRAGGSGCLEKLERIISEPDQTRKQFLSSFVKASPSFISGNKKLLQAHVDGAILGQSATQLYTYEVFLWRVPIILTTNNWNLTGLTPPEREWVEANCVAVNIAEPVFQSATPLPTAAASSSALSRGGKRTRQGKQ